MLEKFTRNWWLFAVRGVIVIIFGIMALTRPEQMLQALVLLFGAFMLMNGIFAVIAGIASHKTFDRWWAMLLEGLAGILIGVLTFFSPGITALALLYYIAAWALITGIFEILAAIELRRVIKGEWTLILNGLFSVLFGVLLFVFPNAGALSLVWVIGIYAIFFGIMLIVFAFRMNGVRREVESIVGAEV